MKKLDKKGTQILTAKASIAGSLLLLVPTLIVALMTDSITLLLDSMGSFVVMAMAFLTFFSIQKIHLPADTRYHFGYSKFEPLTVLIQGILIAAICVASVKVAVQDIVHPEDVKSYGLPVLVTLLGGIFGVFITLLVRAAAKNTNSSMLRSSFLHWRTDTMLSFGVCAGFFLGLILKESGFTKITPYIDPVMAIALALYLVREPVKTMAGAAKELLDAAPDGNIKEKVYKVLEAHKPRVAGVHRLRCRKAGDKVFVDVCFEVEGEKNASEIEKLTNSFEQDIKGHFPDCDVVVGIKARQP